VVRREFLVAVYRYAHFAQALRMYFINFLRRTDWNRRRQSEVVDEAGRTSPPAALEQLRLRLRTRHYSYRTESSYADWVRRFLTYLAERQGAPHPRVNSHGVRDYLTHLAVRQHVSASTHVVKELRSPARSPLDILRARTEPHQAP